MTQFLQQQTSCDRTSMCNNHINEVSPQHHHKCANPVSLDAFGVSVSGCLQLLEILEILEISWNLKFFLEILEISWIFVDAPGKMLNAVHHFC